jgi:hypothetical protein
MYRNLLAHNSGDWQVNVKVLASCEDLSASFHGRRCEDEREKEREKGRERKRALHQGLITS